MTVKEIALSAAAILQADDIEALLADESEDATPTDDADVRTLIKCVNLAAAETSSDFPVLKSVTVECDDGIIPLSVFDGVVTTVREVRRGKHRVAFSFDSRGVAVPMKGTYTVVYTVAPTCGDPDDELIVGAGVDSETLTYLAARNYCLVTGRSDEASIWDQRYNAEAENKRLRRRANIPVRDWLG